MNSIHRGAAGLTLTWAVSVGAGCSGGDTAAGRQRYASSEGKPTGSKRARGNSGAGRYCVEGDSSPTE
jgi:hypothetical protein